MARRHIDFLTLSFLISQMIVLSLNTVGADEISVFSQLKNFDATNTISAILSRNWTKNPECLIELTAIKNGIDKHEEWAIRVVDSWGNVPSGVLYGNYYDFGSFSECFHIERNGQPYQTQYCFGHLGKPQFYVFLGICLPAACAVDHFQSIVNDEFRSDLKNLTVGIPRYRCQLEENVSGWAITDFITIGLFGVVVFLMIASTSYDLFCTAYNRVKYQPFIVFSTYTNGQKLFSCASAGPSSGTIQCIEGIRVISMASVVSVHVYRYYRNIPLHERTAYNEFVQSYASVVSFTPMAVETFFVMGGLLVSYKLFKVLKKDGKLNIFSLYVQRYVRLTTLLAVVWLVRTTIYRFAGNGPIWYRTWWEMQDCQHHWWSTMLYIQNYVNPQRMCLISTWYLNVDMQLFIVSPILVYSMHRFKKTTLIAILISILCCVFYTMFVYLNENISYRKYPSYYLVFLPTHFRFPPWLIGFILGFILFECPKGSIRIPKKVNVFAWTLSLIVLLATIILNHPFYQFEPTASSLQHGLFDSLSRIIWPIALSYMIFACVHNCGGPINKFLSLGVWRPLSKLTYAIYLIHLHVMFTVYLTMKSTPHFSAMSAFRDFIAVFVQSTIIAIPLVLAFELPIDGINRLLTAPNKPKIQEK